MTINPKISLTFTGGEPLTSSLTIPVAEYAKKFSAPQFIDRATAEKTFENSIEKRIDSKN